MLLVTYFDMHIQSCYNCDNTDVFLPRVVELATLSSNRRTKVTACELLHALIIYMIGREAQVLGHREVKHSMDSLYKKIFPAVLQLVCDVELVCYLLCDVELVCYLLCDVELVRLL